MMKGFKTPAIVFVFLLCLYGFMAGCNNSETDSVTDIKLKYNDNEITGDSLSVDLLDGPLTFTADVQVTGNASKDFTLTSSASDIAAVSDKSVALIAVGQTTITATAVGDPNKTHAITLNVIIEEPSIPGLSKPYNITNNFEQDSSTAFLVQWHNDVSVVRQKLQIVPETGGFGNTRPVTVRVRKFESSGKVGNFEARNVYKAYVTGLSPNTRYKYRMGDVGAWSDTFYHLTSSGNADDFSFTVVSDPQSEAHIDMANTLRAADAFDPNSKFYLMGGDLVDEIAKNPTEIVSYTTTANEFNINKPIAATQGNHDTYFDDGTSNAYRFGEATVFNKFVTFPDNGWDTNADKINRSQSYYFYYNKVLIIMLNTMSTNSPAGASSGGYSTQVQWLRNILERDRADGLSRYTIVVTHISPFGRNSNNTYSNGVRLAHGKIFSDFEVDIVFAGHDHVYGRSNPIKIGANTTLSEINFEPTPNGTIFSIVGATGPKFYTLDTSDTWVPKFYPVRTDQQSPGVFVNVKVTAEKLIVTAMRVGGTVLDTYEVTAK